MKKRYIVKRGPVQPPYSLYGRRPPLQTGDTLESADNAWIRGCLRDQRLAVHEPKRKGKAKNKAQDDGGRHG